MQQLISFFYYFEEYIWYSLACNKGIFFGMECSINQVYGCAILDCSWMDQWRVDAVGMGEEALETPSPNIPLPQTSAEYPRWWPNTICALA